MAEITLETGVTLAYEETGSREDPPVILVHGVSMSRRYFHKQMGPLGEHNRVIAVDLRAHGGSEKVPSGTRSRNMGVISTRSCERSTSGGRSCSVGRWVRLWPSTTSGSSAPARSEAW